MQRDSPSEFLLYLQTAGAIRSLPGFPPCEAEYFRNAVAANPGLSTATALVSAAAVRPVKGWKHRDMEELLKQIELVSPQDFLPKLKEQLLLKPDLERLRGRGTLTLPPVNSRPVRDASGAP
jgi:hypothetical protein